MDYLLQTKILISLLKLGFKCSENSRVADCVTATAHRIWSKGTGGRIVMCIRCPPIPALCGFLSSRHGASSGWGWRRRLPDMEGNYDIYIE